MGKTLKTLSFRDITKPSSHHNALFSFRHMDGVSSSTSASGLTIDMCGGRKNFTVDDYISRVLLERPTCAIALADEAPFHAGYKRYAKASERSLKWFQQLIFKTRNLPIKVYGVVNGGMKDEAIVELARKLLTAGASGLVVGGCGSGESPEDRSRAIRALRGVLDAQGISKYLIVQCMNSLPEVSRTVFILIFISC